MKLATYSSPDGPAVAGVLTGGALVCLQTAHRILHGRSLPAFAEMAALIAAWEAEGQAAAEAMVAAAPDEAVWPLAEVRLLAPLPRPAQMRDFLSFETHFRQARAAIQRLLPGGGDPTITAEAPLPAIFHQQPVYYKANRFAVCGPETDVVWPKYSQLMDFELELAAVIGRPGRDISAQAARGHIFGFTIFNDFSARDAQIREMPGTLGPAKGKDFDNANALGPWIVTRDEISDPYGLRMTARVNGELWTDGVSGDMHWSFEQMIAHVSQDETLHPAEVIGSGTVGGGCGLELGRFLEHGDVVELEIERIGVLRNRVLRAEGAALPAA
jgi:2-keto-4-pentenoate hydratase/2-oxohepta-3-ene-1,7-dioic acid hydratase in catechol pathway